MSAILAPIEPALESLRAPDRRRRFWLIPVALWFISGVYLVQPDQQAVVTRFGGVVERRVAPGLHYALPWPVDSVYKLKVLQTRRLEVGGELVDGVLGKSGQATAQFITGDQNIIDLSVVVQYSVSDPALFLFRTQNVAAGIGFAVESDLAVEIGHARVDDVLTTEKVAIQNRVRAAAQKDLDEEDSGVVLASVNIDQAAPPPEAADAFRDVAGARADAIRTINEAQGYSNDIIPRARGEAAQILDSAQAYRQSKVNIASGDAARFVEIAAEYDKAPKVTSDRTYLEAMEQILPKIKKMIVDPNANLDLTMVRRSDAPKK